MRFAYCALRAAGYDSSGEILSASYMDYSISRADNLPKMEVLFDENPQSLA
jgi:hypothetical protein